MEIEFIESYANPGKQIPGQRVKSVYRLRDGHLEKMDLVGWDGVYVNHFETCPKAGQFSGGRKGS